MKKISTIFLCCVAVTLPAKAELLTYNFTAAIERLDDNVASWNELQSATFAGHSFAVGDKVKGILTYNTATPLSWYQSAHSMWTKEIGYGGMNLGNTITLTYEKSNLSFTFDVPRITLFVPGYPDFLTFHGQGDATRARISLATYQFSSTNLPAYLPAYVPNSAGSFMSYTITQYLGYDFFGISSRINSFDLMPTTPVPEPATYAMLLTGLVGVGFAARRRQAIR